MIQDIMKEVDEKYGKKKPEESTIEHEEVKKEEGTPVEEQEKPKEEPRQQEETKTEESEKKIEENQFSLEDNFVHYKKELGEEFEDLNSLKSFIASSRERSEKIEALEADAKRKTDLEEQVRLLEERIDPLANFATKEDYVVQQLKKDMPDASGAILEKIIKSDPKDFSELEASAIDMALTSGIDVEMAKKLVASEVGIDLEDENWSSVDEWNDIHKGFAIVRCNSLCLLYF